MNNGITFKSGRTIFFENIVSVKEAHGQGLTFVLSNKEQVQLKNLTKDEFLAQRREYFAQLAVQGEITQEFGLSVVSNLQKELKLAIETLQASTTAYNTSASLANTASADLVATSDRVGSEAKECFKDAKSISRNAAKDFRDSVNSTVNGVISPVAQDLASTVLSLQKELDFIDEE